MGYGLLRYRYVATAILHGGVLVTDKRTKKIAVQVYRFDLQHPYGVIFLCVGYGLAIGFGLLNRNSPLFYVGLGIASMTLWLRTRKEIKYEEVSLDDYANPKSLGEKLGAIIKKWWDSIPSSRDKRNEEH